MENTFIILFSIATIVAIAVRRTQVPYTVALVVVGLGVGSLGIVNPPRLTKEILFSLFLPGLVFEAAYNIHAAELRQVWRTTTALAGPGLIVAILLTAAGVTWGLQTSGIQPDFGWRDGLAFAAVVSATDPIAVVSLFRRLGVSPKLTTLVEAESLFNDGTSIVALTLILSFEAGESSSLVGLVGQFVLVVCGGALIGAAVAYIATAITRRIDDPMIEITLTTITAYGSFALAEYVHVSGVIATVMAGLVLGTHTRETAFSPSTRAAADAFWEYLAFALNSIVFLLIGFQVRPSVLLRTAPVIAIASIVMLGARMIIVFAATGALRRTRERISAPWSVLVTWGGLRGALAMVLALSLPSEFPHRALLIDMTYGVVVISLLVQGLTIPALTRHLAGKESAPVIHAADRSREASREAGA